MKTLLITLLIMAASTTFANESDYTSVAAEDCITTESAEWADVYEIDYYTGLCHGKADYVVEISGGDIRYGLNLIYKGHKLDNLTRVYSFHDLGSSKVEWRYSKKNGVKNYKALIFRINGSGGYPNKDIQYMHIVKLNKKKTCTVAVLVDETNMNVKARKIADNINNYSCL